MFPRCLFVGVQIDFFFRCLLPRCFPFVQCPMGGWKHQKKTPPHGKRETSRWAFRQRKWASIARDARADGSNKKRRLFTFNLAPSDFGQQDFNGGTSEEPFKNAESGDWNLAREHKPTARLKRTPRHGQCLHAQPIAHGVLLFLIEKGRGFPGRVFIFFYFATLCHKNWEFFKKSKAHRWPFVHRWAWTFETKR